MGFELVRETKESCGCVVKYYEHDFWPTDNYKNTNRCPRHEEEHQEQAKKATERDQQERREHDRVETELRRIAAGNNTRAHLSKLVPSLYTRNLIINGRENGIGSLFALEKVKNRWMCNKEATLYYMNNEKSFRYF